MRVSKVILNDKGRPITKDQARRELRESLLAAVLNAYKDGLHQIEIAFDMTIDDNAEITVGDLAKRIV